MRHPSLKLTFTEGPSKGQTVDVELRKCGASVALVVNDWYICGITPRGTVITYRNVGDHAFLRDPDDLSVITTGEYATYDD